MRNNYQIQIDWRKVHHITPKVDENVISLNVKNTQSPLPRVMVITEITDLVLFNFNLFSWNSVLYPRELLNWVVWDPKRILKNKIEDDTVRVVNTKFKSYDSAVKAFMEYSWLGDSTFDRPLYYTSMECGSVWFPDTLSLKFKCLEHDAYDCVIPDSLAYYSVKTNDSLVRKLFLKYPRDGLYWKKRWWNVKPSHNIVGVPYLANSVTIGEPKLHGLEMKASVRFFDSFPPDVKEMLFKMRKFIQFNVERDDRDDESNDEKEEFKD